MAGLALRHASPSGVTPSSSAASGPAPTSTQVSDPISVSDRPTTLDENIGPSLDSRQRFQRQLPRHVAELLHRQPERVQEADMEVRKLCVREPVMLPTLQLIR